MYNVIFENSRAFKVLFTGQLAECKQFLRTTDGIYGDDIFVSSTDEECYLEYA